MADAVALQDSHGRIVAGLGIVPVWHSQAERQFVPDPRL